MAKPSSTTPPKPDFTLSVGVIGHRPNRLPGQARAQIADEVDQVLKRIFICARESHKRYEDLYTGQDPRLTCVSELAEGADRIVAKSALENGYRLTAILPFDSEDYESDFKEDASRKEYRSLLARADTTLALPGQRAHETAAYQTAGLTLVDNVDLVVAIWDGGASAGRGGTTDLIEHAARNDVPIVHIDANGEEPPRALWSGLEQFKPASEDVFECPSRDVSPALSRIVNELKRPPGDADELRRLSRYLGEKWRGWNWRVELPVLFAIMAIRAFRKTDIRPTAPERLAEDFADFAESTDEASTQVSEREAQNSVSQDAVSREALAYGWADALAIRYAQVFRGAYVSNFVSAALASLAGVLSLVCSKVLAWPDWPFGTIEVLLIGFIFLNTYIGRKQEWHTRWREAREVAERMRAANVLQPVALSPITSALTGGTWVDWYARAHARGIGLPSGAFDDARLAQIKNALLSVAQSQCAYHAHSAKLMRGIERRIELLGHVLLGLAVVIAVVNLGFYFAGVELEAKWEYVLLGLTAALPALGAATFGIRLIGDFEGVAERDDRTSGALSAVAAALQEDTPKLAALRSWARAVADTMLGDLSHWRVATESRKLVEPV